MDAMLGFAAGVMTAASFFSLLSPAIEHCKELNLTMSRILSIKYTEITLPYKSPEKLWI